MIWNLAIRRPVLTVVAFIVIAIFGVFGYLQMPLREYPDVEFPIVSVNVVLPGAEPEVIETEIVEPLEEEINTVEGLKTLTSTAREEVATITAEFELWRDIDVAAQDVRDRVDRAQRGLPDDVEAPMVRKLDPDAQPIMWIALTGDERWDRVRLSRYADRSVKERLQNLRGVGQILIGGEQRFAARVRLDPEELAAHGVTAQDVVDTIRANNVDIPSGRVESEQREFLVKVRGQFSSPEPLNELIVAHRDGAPVRLGDLGEAVAGVENERQLARFSGEPSVGLGVVKQSDANTVALSEDVRARIETMAEGFPDGLEYTIATDASDYVQQNIRDLVTTIFLATALVMSVVFVFLRSGSATFITSLAIPTSLLGGMAAIWILGFSLNVMSMLGFILAIGIVVDDAIVVLEANHRHIEQGAEPTPAARTGTTEVAFAAIANTLALAAVFLPVAFTGGLIGRFFYEFGLTVAVTVLLSTFTALTLTAMLCSRLLRGRQRQAAWLERTERAFERLEAGYRRLLDRAFAHRGLTVLAGILAFGVGLLAFRALPTEFAPSIDRSEFMIQFETPEGATLRATNDYAREIEAVLKDMPEVEHFFLAIGLGQGGVPGKVNQGVSFVSLTPRSERDRHQTAIMQEARGALAEIPEGQAYVMEADQAGAGGAPLQLVLQHDDIEAIAREQERLVEWMRSQPQYVGVSSDLKMNKPQVEVSIQRDKASEMGVSVAEISNTLRFLLGDPDVSNIEQEAERYDVITELAGEGRVPEAIGDLYVRSGSGALVSLANLVSLQEGIGPSEIHHFNRLRAATVSSSLPPDAALGDALDVLYAHLDASLAPGFEYEVTGQAQSFQESFYYLTLTVILAVVFIYLVLAAQFESFVHPFTILTTLPLAMIGAFGALYVFGMTFNIFTFIGLIMLLGMVTKNAILLVDYANVLRARGLELGEAAREAAITRFRPVLMTAISTILGITPIALGYGAGGESRAPLGVSVAAGMLAATMLTLVVIPVVYTLVDALQTRLGRVLRRRPVSEAAA